MLPNNFGKDYVAHLYVVRVNNREQLIKKLYNTSIATDIHYPIPDYKQNSLSGIFSQTSLANTEKCCEKVLSLPCFPEISNDEVNKIIKFMIET